MRKKQIGRYIVADPKICHGQPTFTGSRILVASVLELVADGMPWDRIVQECHNSISRDAIAEAVRLAGRAFVKHVGDYAQESVPA